MRRSEFPYPNDSGKGWLNRIEITIKKNVLLSLAYLLRAQLVMSFPSAKVGQPKHCSLDTVVLCESMLFRSGTLAPVSSTADLPDKP
jgi:hypothetical protein